jgi:hypothetical protein
MTMSHLPILLRAGPWAAQANLNRLNLLYRFDFRQRTWVLQALEIRRDNNSPLPAGLAALALAIAKNISDFSDPALGGDKTSRTADRRMGIRHSLRWSWRKSKKPKLKP